MSLIPIVRVTVMEDRAQVEREGTLSVNQSNTFLVGGISPLAVDRSLKVAVQGGKLLDSKLIRRFKEKPASGLSENAGELEKRIHALDEEIAGKQLKLRTLDHRASLFETARADLLRAIGEQSGNNAQESKTWSAQFESLTQQQHALDDDRTAQNKTLAELHQKLSDARNSFSISGKKEQTFECLLSLTIEGTKEVTVKASYLVPCAAWRPAYRATLIGNQVNLEAEAYVWQHTFEEWNNVTLCCSTARPTLGTSPPPLVDDVISTRAKQEMEKKQIQVQVREEAIQNTGAGSNSNELPGLDDGGETRLLQVKHAVSVRSDGQPHRFKLFELSAPTQTELVASPEVSPSVFCISKFTNVSKDVLLAGPVDLIRESQFIGRGQLKFASPNEFVQLSFGPQDGLQVIRHQEEKHDESRLTGKKTRTKKLKYFVSNQNAVAHKIVIEERVIVSELKEIEVSVVAKESNPVPSVSSEGIARIPLEVAAKSTGKAHFSWELTAASTVAGI
jgi:uncharacterized protein (TIGR02231 family)